MVILCVAHHVHDEGIVDLRHQPLFIVDVIDLLELDNFMLLHELHRIELAIHLVPGQVQILEFNMLQQIN